MDITLRLVERCLGGNHAVVTASDGTRTRTVRATVDELRAPATAEEADEFLRSVLRLWVLARKAEGQTLNQMAQALTTGVTVEI